MRRVILAIVLVASAAAQASAQVNQRLAEQYFAEARAICERDKGELWGVSLCGPMVIADAGTKTMATNQRPPAESWPAALGFANAAMNWDGTRWSTFVWQLIPADPQRRARLLIHELFHRVQPELGLLLSDGQNEHLDTVKGRYWMQLEWRALSAALKNDGQARMAAIRDAMAFRAARRAEFPGAAELERAMEINEGLAQYTGTVLAAGSLPAAITDAIQQLAEAEQAPTFVRSFPYPSGAAYGMLFDVLLPGWRTRIKSTDDFGLMLSSGTRSEPTADTQDAAARYDGPALMVSEEARARSRQSLIEELRRRFVTGPVLVLPRTQSSSANSSGMTPIPGSGMVLPSFRTTAIWGTLVADQVLVAPDRSRLTLPAPTTIEGQTITGPGYRVELAAGWIVRPGQRAGDFEVVKR